MTQPPDSEVRIRDIAPQDAERLVPFRRELFGETEFMLYGPGEYGSDAGGSGRAD